MNTTSPSELVAARVAREKAAHEDSHIDDAVRKWWAVFPHVFSNPSMENLHAFYEGELGQLQGRRVLEYGCGKGDFAFWLLGQGASVCGIDVSDFNIKQCQDRASSRNYDPEQCTFMVMDAHQLKFPDNSFDLVVGNGILHHLDLSLAMQEVTRVLKPGGKALFQEPLGDNPLLRFYRKIAGIHTVDERPLIKTDIDYLTAEWNARVKYSGLVTLPFALVTSIVLRPYSNNWLLRIAAAVEERVNDKHILDNWNRFTVVVYQKPA
jgi:ubiquinone/menaquinone biosynthesis C-methylase UbiE